MANTLPQFDRDRPGSLYYRGAADGYYERKPWPHWYPNGTYNGEAVQAATLEEVNEYMTGYTECTTRKEW